MIITDFAIFSLIPLILLFIGIAYKRKTPIFVAGCIFVILGLIITPFMSNLEYCNGSNFTENVTYNYNPAGNISNTTTIHLGTCNETPVEWAIWMLWFIIYIGLGLACLMHTTEK